MIKANELRIGNLVTIAHESNEPIIKVYSITHGFINVFDNKSGYDLNFVLPILLTEEWLLKCGAKLFPWGFVINEILIRFTKHPQEKFWIELGNGNRIELPYVHTLQNFYALTGEELLIKQPV